MTFYMWEKKGVTVLWMTKDPTGNKIFDAQRWFLYYWMIGCRSCYTWSSNNLSLTDEHCSNPD